MSETLPSNASSFRITGRHVLFGIVGFFAIVIGVDALFMTLALRSYPGEVSATPFEDGLAFNRKLAERAAQAGLGYHAVAEAQPGAVRVRLARSDGAALVGARLQGALTRPATEAGRRALAFREVEPGLYVADARGADGVWDLALTARDPEGRGFEAQRRLMWPR